ncbi:MAG TPA: hypothetical protein VII28_07935 [Puia sp.]
MIVYNRTSLDNMTIRNQAHEAFDAGCISPEENKKISDTHPVNFYTPNIFICIGLFLLTVVIAAFSLGLFFLIIESGIRSFVPPMIFSFLVCYVVLEYIVSQRRHFRSGVDYALLWMSAAFLCAGIYMSVDHMSAIFLSFTFGMIGILFTLRFANFIMAAVVYGALLAFIVNIAAELGRTAQVVTPFIIMGVSVAGWFLSVRLYHRDSLRHYRQSLTVIQAATGISFYLAGNYYIVSELGNYMFGSSQPEGAGISMGWFFWMFTVVTPLFYIYQGIRKKDSIFLWTGLALTAATVFTIRHYYSVLPAEWAMIVGGIVIIAISYGLTTYLKTARKGFTSRERSNKQVLENLNLESLVIAETFAGSPVAPAPNNDFQFGGGTGGGGGAGGQY